MKKVLRQYGAATLSGILLAASFPTWHLFPLAWVALVPLLVASGWWLVARGQGSGGRDQAEKSITGRQPPATSHQPLAIIPFRHFFVAGMAFHLMVLQWLLTNFYWTGGWAFWGYLALCAILSLFWGLTGMVWMWLCRRLPRVPASLTLPVLWLAMEFLQGTLFSGFGWSSLAYSQGIDLPLVQWAALGGGPLVSAILVGVNALVARAIAERRGRVWRLLAAAGVVALSHGVGRLLLAPADYDSMPLTVGIVQPDYPLEMKWDAEYTVEMVRNAAEKSRILAGLHQVDLLVWPESLIMDAIDRPEIDEIVSNLTRDLGCALYTGSERFDKGRCYNSSYLVDPAGKAALYYDKIHLAPFGEYAPFGDYLPFVRRVVPAISDITAGTTPKVFDVAGRRFGPLICFEVLFAPMAERLHGLGADFLVVVTNLGWFGASNAIPQEIEIARIRAIETRLPLVHCANTGISGVFDPWGRLSVVDTWVDPAGRYLARIKEPIQNRVIGALPVAAPAPEPIPLGPALCPWAACALSAALILCGAILAKRNRETQ